MYIVCLFDLQKPYKNKFSRQNNEIRLLVNLFTQFLVII